MPSSPWISTSIFPEHLFYHQIFPHFPTFSHGFPSPGAGTQGALVALRALRGHPGTSFRRAHRGAGAAGAALVQEAGGSVGHLEEYVTDIRFIDIYIYISGWWFGTFFIFAYIGNNNPN